ncbi:PAP/OAS1 substrate-binding domain superfamily [Raphanus sativus]|nr:PAP/OAS1 substrate-binding domain superfamily [Raphanus sativus]
MAAADIDDCSVMEKSSSSFSRLPPTLSPSEFWNRVEDVTREIIELVHPTLVSEDRRRNVIDYMQRLIKMTLGCEVHSFGSVPLKTYLPDGDIDLTAFGGAFGGPWNDDELAHKVFSLLESEKQNVDAQFIIKDVKLILAEVKLVTCLVENLVVDISFNKLGGISTLCFLEKVDHLIGKDHLFKRSIILVKAWCYYESHILGAVHGLISTYALETLVLYILQLFHSSLDGPLAVLYKFLDYFSKFDWDNYCISLSGPVCRSSLPEIVVETPENGGQDLLLTSEFLNNCLEIYCLPSRDSETNARAFQSKYLNIVDPLKENNNLGRSVNKANFNRIRAAFTFGARKLGKIILQSEEEDISLELPKFFSNMLRKHRSGQRPDAVPSASAANHVQEGQMLDKESVSPLNGDSVSQLYSLVYGRWWLGYVQNGPLLTQDNSWEVFPHALPLFIPNAPLGLVNPDGTLVFLVNPQMIPNTNAGLQELPKPQGTGTYFPNVVAEELPEPQGTGTYFPNVNVVAEELPKPQGTGTCFPNVVAEELPTPSSRRRSRRNNRRRHHQPNQTNGCCDMSQAGILGSYSGTNGSINHPHEPLPAKGRKKSDVITSIPSSMQEDRYSIFSDH